MKDKERRFSTALWTKSSKEIHRAAHGYKYSTRIGRNRQPEGGMTAMPFGKFRGQQITELPDWYLDWIVANIELREPLLSAIEDEVRFRERSGYREEPEPVRATLTLKIDAGDGMLVRDIFERGFRAAVRATHPDAGGDHNAMVRLNHVAESLRAQFRELGS